MNVFIPIMAVTLFFATKTHFGPVQLRPFDALAALLLVWTVIRFDLVMRTRITAGFLILIPFFLIHILSALSVSSSNGFREILQVTLLMGVAVVLVVASSRLDYRKAGTILLVGLFVVMAYNVGWHIAHGYWSGWKRLNDPKAAFTFLPMLLALFLLFAPADKRKFYWVLWGFVGVIVLFSGERKALLSFAMMTVALVGRGRLLVALPVIAAGLVALSIFASISNDPYMSRQINTLLEPTAPGPPLAAMAHGVMPESLSDAARDFTSQQVVAMWKEHPVFGVGTNSYYELIKTRFAYLPEFMKVSAHGEFLRVLVENGVVGIFFYGLIWMTALVRSVGVSRFLRRKGAISAAQARILPIILIFPPILYISFEAAGTRSFMTLIISSLAPDFLYWALYGQKRRAAESGAVAEKRHPAFPVGHSA